MPGPHEFVGSPQEIGREIFEKFCMPAIKAVANKAPPNEFVLLYAGFIGGAAGSMCADFGKELTAHFIR